MPFSRAPWWMYIVAASLLGNFALNVYVYLGGPEPPFSQYTFARAALVVEEVLPNSAGDRAGLQVGDRVLAIDGRRVLGLGQWDLIRINFEVGKPYRLQVERDGKPLERVMTLQRRSWSQQAQYQRISFVLNTASALLTLLVAFLVAFTRPYDWVARIGALSIALLGGSAYLYGTCCHCPALANLRRCAHLVAGSGLFHISRAVLRFLLNFSRANCSVPAGFGWRTCPLFFFCCPSLALPTSHS